MLDALLLVGFPCCLWLSRDPEPSGLPLMFVAVAMMWYTHIWPHQCYEYGPIEWDRWLLLIILSDLLQTLSHYAIHHKYFGMAMYNSHQIHHEKKSPQPDDAFYTGVLDAMVQLILPILATVGVVAPNRTTLLLFGLAYSQWLLYIHSHTRALLPDNIFVSPDYHRMHHSKPLSHYSSVFIMWDYIL